MSMGSIILQIFMWIAVLMTIILLVPAVYGVFKSCNTVSISKMMYIFYPICSVCWIVYAILMVYDNVPIYEIIGIAVSEGISMLMSFYILIVKVMNQKKASNMHMSEEAWHRAYIKRKEWEKRLRRLGIKNNKDLQDNKEQQGKLIAILHEISIKYQDIVDYRITHSNVYQKTVRRDIKTFKHRFDHFRNVAANAEIAGVISLVYLDIYKESINS